MERKWQLNTFKVPGQGDQAFGSLHVGGHPWTRSFSSSSCARLIASDVTSFTFPKGCKLDLNDGKILTTMEW